MVTEKPLVNFHTDEELLGKLDRWQHHNLFSSRAEAIRWLIEYGIEKAPTVKRPPRRRGGRNA